MMSLFSASINFSILKFPLTMLLRVFCTPVVSGWLQITSQVGHGRQCPDVDGLARQQTRQRRRARPLDSESDGGFGKAFVDQQKMLDFPRENG